MQAPALAFTCIKILQYFIIALSLIKILNSLDILTIICLLIKGFIPSNTSHLDSEYSFVPNSIFRLIITAFIIVIKALPTYKQMKA